MTYGRTFIHIVGFLFSLLIFSRPVCAYPTVGKASWYGKQHQGRKMANGERFDKEKMTAANFDLPLGSVIRVFNLDNGSSVVVTITDRGPAKRLHRILDLSEAAANTLGYKEKGITKVFYSQAIFEQESSRITSELEDDGVREIEKSKIETDVQSDSGRVGTAE